jgi:hypothetical protein
MNWTEPTVEETALLLRALKGPQLERMRRAVCGEPDRFKRALITSREFIVLCVSDWLSSLTPLGELEQSLLLQQFKPRLCSQADRLIGLQEGAEVPPLLLNLAEFKYATWPELGEWWDIRNAVWMTKPPRPSLFLVALDVNVLWFLSLRQLGQSRKVRNTNYVNRTDVAAETEGQVGG